ncbi:MAG: permease, partial [Candidatus Omnitrophica bacterium]|nr:permease [Candidatus Omnitrophota bacterium]
ENIFGKKDETSASLEKNSCKYCGIESKHTPTDHKLIQKIKYGMRYAFIDLLGDIAKWLIIGIVIGGAISYFTPANFVERFLGSDFKAMLIMLVIGIPLYICASGSTPIAAALIVKGMSPGVALVFLLAGWENF